MWLWTMADAGAGGEGMGVIRFVGTLVSDRYGWGWAVWEHDELGRE